MSRPNEKNPRNNKKSNKRGKKLLNVAVAVIVISSLLIIGVFALLRINNCKSLNEFFRRIRDDIPPTIEVEDEINIFDGYELDLSDKKLVKVSDNSDNNNDIKVSVSGDIDTNKKGKYDIKIVAKDKSGNKSEKDVIVNVIDENDVKEGVTFYTRKGYKGECKGGITKIDGTIIANKSFTVSPDYNPGSLTDEAKQAWDEMVSVASQDGINLKIVSGFRSYNTQQNLYKNYVASDGKANADRYSARAGYSEHQTGLAADINLVEDEFKNSKEGKWLANNAGKYGWILRYPYGKENLTGYMPEPWHYRFVGKDLSQKVFDNGEWTTLEEYFGIKSEYA